MCVRSDNYNNELQSLSHNEYGMSPRLHSVKAQSAIKFLYFWLFRTFNDYRSTCLYSLQWNVKSTPPPLSSSENEILVVELLYSVKYCSSDREEV